MKVAPLGSVPCNVGVQLLEICPVLAWAMKVTVKPLKSVSSTNRESRLRFMASNLVSLQGIKQRAYVDGSGSWAWLMEPLHSHQLKCIKVSLEVAYGSHAGNISSIWLRS